MNLEDTAMPSRKSFLFGNAIPLSDKQNKLLNILFYTVLVSTVTAMLGIILYYVYAFAATYWGSSNFDWLLSIFSDFVEIMNASLRDSPYLTNGTSYPPLAVIVLYPFAWICRSVFASYSGMELTVDELTSRVVLHWEFWVAIVLFFIVCISAILLIILKKYRFDPISAVKVSILIIMSAPFVYAIMRGNTIYFALIFSLLFLLLYDSPKAWVREIAYLCLVIAGCIKIYPLFFGVYLLKKKNFFAVFRTAVYFFILFFLSFHLFKTGLGGMDPFLDNLGGFMFNNERLLSLRNLSVSSLLYKIFYLLSPALAESTVFAAVNLGVLILIFASATLTATVTRSHLSRAAIAAGVVILIPTVSYFYVLIFEILPCLELIRHADELSRRKRIVYTAFFLFLFFSPILLSQCFVPHGLIVIALLVAEEYHVLRHEILPWLSAKRNKATAL